MKEKLTLQDLVDLLAKKAGLTKKEADAFFREFLALITENIFNNEPVKIKDFGTFKLTLVNSRESVNVNTGEKIEIPAHHKLSFLPDKSLKALINKPFEHFETELLNDETTFDSIEISEESEEVNESPELEDTAIDEPDFIDKAIVNEPPVAEEVEEKEEEVIVENEVVDIIDTDAHVEEIEINEPEKESEPESSQKADTPSFVYTYTEDTQHSGEDVITINVPSQQLIDEMTRAIENIKPTIAPQQTISDQTEYEEEPNNNVPSLEINKVHEKIGQLKDAIDSLSHISSQKPQDIDSEESEKTRSSEGKELTNSPINEKHHLTEDSDEVLDSNDSQDEDLNYYNYNKTSLWSKIAHRLPIIIFLLVVIVAGIYLFSKLFEQRQIYDNFASFQSMAEVDTLPNASKNVVTYPEFDKDPFASNAIDYIEQTTDTLNNNAEEDFLDQKISKNLSIDVVSKAKYLLANKNDSVLQIVLPEVKDIKPEAKVEVKAETNKTPAKQFPLKETVIPGSSLRSIANRQYGDGALWVYIYQENKSKMKGYDNLSVGQIITVPNLQKYNTSIDDPKMIEKAKELERKIFSEKSK